MNSPASDLLQEHFAFAMREHGEDLVDLYIDSCTRELEGLEEAHRAGDFPRVVLLAHRAMGASAVLGFLEIMKLLRALEQSAQEKNLPEVRRSIDAFAEMVSQLKRLLL